MRDFSVDQREIEVLYFREEGSSEGLHEDLIYGVLDVDFWYSSL